MSLIDRAHCICTHIYIHAICPYTLTHMYIQYILAYTQLHVL